MHTIAALAAAVLGTAAFPAAAARPLPTGLAKLSPDHFAQRVRVIDDPLEPAIVFSTEPAHRKGQPLIGAYADDVHLRALVDRQSGQVTWQVSHSLINFHHRADIVQVQYAAGGAVHTVAPAWIGHSQDLCSPGDNAGHCYAYLHVVFELPGSVVKEVAAAWTSGSRQAWPVRFKDSGGRDITAGLAPAELAGLLRAVESGRLEGTARL